MLKTVFKYGVAIAAGIVAAELLSEDTRKQICKAADGVATDVKARAKEIGAAIAEAWKKEVCGEKPRPPADPKPPAEPKDTPPAASA